MSRYQVNATIAFAAWVDVEAETPDEAMDAARELDASAFEYDTGTAYIEFNSVPDVEPAP